MKRFSILSLLFSAIAFQSGNVRADEPLTSHEGLQSTLWVQTSLEYQLAAHQCYNTATDRLPFYLANVNHSATVETSVNFRLLPPAVIMDVDETVLDNSPFQARMVQDETQYAEEDWDAWVKEMNADAVPGAVG
ncbi:MAG: HAD family acid phosphatase, partial [Planctomycetota bacterium]